MYIYIYIQRETYSKICHDQETKRGDKIKYLAKLIKQDMNIRGGKAEGKNEENSLQHKYINICIEC